MRLRIILPAFILALGLMTTGTAWALQTQSPAITRDGTIVGPGAIDLQAALMRFYKSGSSGKQSLIFVTFRQGYTGTESSPYAFVPVHVEFADNAVFFGTGVSGVKRVALDQPRGIHAEIMRQFKLDQLYVISVGAITGSSGGMLWHSPDYDAFDKWMRENVPDWPK